MADWFSALAPANSLAKTAAEELERQGFTIIPGPVPPGRMSELTDAYDAAIASAIGNDIRAGSTTTRVNDLVNRGARFDDLYVYQPLLDACLRVIGRPFRLSSLLARTLRPHQPAQGLHVDVRRDSADWPLLGFILMVDEFNPDNGATCFIPGSHAWPETPQDATPDQSAVGQVPACGHEGSLIVFNGSAWHGHGVNTTSEPRRSIQGFFIPRDGQAGTDFAARMTPETRARLSPLAHHLLAL